MIFSCEFDGEPMIVFGSFACLFLLHAGHHIWSSAVQVFCELDDKQRLSLIMFRSLILLKVFIIFDILLCKLTGSDMIN